MKKTMFAVSSVLLMLAAATVFAQGTPPNSHKGKEHRKSGGTQGITNSRKAGGTQKGMELRKSSGGATTNLMGDGSVRFNRQESQSATSAIGYQTSGAGAGKITIKSGTSEGGPGHSAPGNKRVKPIHKAAGGVK